MPQVNCVPACGEHEIYNGIPLIFELERSIHFSFPFFNWNIPTRKWTCRRLGGRFSQAIRLLGVLLSNHCDRPVTLHESHETKWLRYPISSWHIYFKASPPFIRSSSRVTSRRRSHRKRRVAKKIVEAVHQQRPMPYFVPWLHRLHPLFHSPEQVLKESISYCFCHIWIPVFPYLFWQY